MRKPAFIALLAGCSSLPTINPDMAVPKGSIKLASARGPLTAEQSRQILAKLKAGGYKVVQMKAKAPVATLAEYDAEVVKDAKLPTVSARPRTSGTAAGLDVTT